MKINKLFFIAALMLAIHVVPSTQQLLPKIPILSSLVKPFTSSIPFGGLLDPSVMMKIVEAFTELAGALQRSDFLLVGMKSLQIFRGLIQVVNLAGLNELDGFLELIHGVMESIHPVLISLKNNAQIIKAEEIAAGNGQFFQELGEDKTSPVGLLMGGFKMLTSLPKMAINL